MIMQKQLILLININNPTQTEHKLYKVNKSHCNTDYKISGKHQDV